MSLIPEDTPKSLKIVLVCFLVMHTFMPIAQIAVGAVYQHDCPRQPYIPIYLIVMGVVILLLCVLYSLSCTVGSVTCINICHGLVSLFCFCWFITGNVWIYSIYEPNYNETASSPDTYCNKTLYLFAFWTTNLNYISLGLILVLICCMSFLSRCV